MATKPDKETILETYSLKELLDLAKEKDKYDRNKRKEEMERHLSAISDMIAGIESGESQFQSREIKAQKASPIPTPTAQVKRNPKPERKSEPKSQPRPAARSESKKPLFAMQLDVIGKKPMSVDQIMESLEKAGWESKAKSPRTVLFIELGKLIDKHTLKKAGRGMYARR